MTIFIESVLFLFIFEKLCIYLKPIECVSCLFLNFKINLSNIYEDKRWIRRRETYKFVFLKKHLGKGRGGRERERGEEGTGEVRERRKEGRRERMRQTIGLKMMCFERASMFQIQYCKVVFVNIILDPSDL